MLFSVDPIVSRCEQMAVHTGLVRTKANSSSGGYSVYTCSISRYLPLHLDLSSLVKHVPQTFHLHQRSWLVRGLARIIPLRLRFTVFV
jgi:hypothetical protein